ncbi:acetylglutamate kinase [Egibacter rhizosphaerae]|uniref:Acetylglutamate kinase n=1 Tax=Egibacter rhizosphaerae TaxID=1670831 RepID=A0A411YLS8_9ACTN|nr:acetylglutamate kinase [Egibacter rhizosphaerae]QBI22140.1 acetylglutamate kinase [Egibacter rhizosphaerae]
MLPPSLTDRTKLAQEKARVLREALPWITRWRGRTVVVKWGGNVATDGGPDEATAAFAADIALMRSVGVDVVVVHGGGPQISELGGKLGLEPTFVDGQRVTDEATLDVVQLVLLGQVNPWLVGLVSAAGAPASGVSGTDAGLVTARPADARLGRVGDVASVDPTLLRSLLADGAVPVVATLGRAADGAVYNINADRVAGAIATALDADKLIYLTNVSGLYEHFGTEHSTLLSVVSADRLRRMLADGTLEAGMVPKIGGVVDALDGGVPQAHLLDGRIEHALLLEVFTDEGIGTMVTPRGEEPSP